MIELRAATGVAYDGREQGTLQLFRTQQQLDHIHGDVDVLKQYGVPFEVLDPKGCVAAEPGLATAAVPFVGACACPMTTPAIARCSPSSSRPSPPRLE